MTSQINDVVEKAWSIQVEGSQSFKLARKIRLVKTELLNWNKSVLDLPNSKSRNWKTKFRKSEARRENLELEASLCLELEDWSEKEEIK